MTPCQKLGYKVGDEFEVHETGAAFGEGEVIVLFDDDGTDCPEFKYKGGKYGKGFIHLSRVRPLTITLRPGDYCSTDNMTESEYHAVADAFMEAGADSHEYPDKNKMNNHNAFGWSVSTSGLLHACGPSFSLRGRHLTPAQIIGAANAKPKWQRHRETMLGNNCRCTIEPQQGPKAMSGKDGEKLGVKRTVTIDIAGLNAEPQQEPTPMTVIDTLHEAKRQRDEAAEKLKAAEAVLNTALDAVRAELGEGFIIKEAGDSDFAERTLERLRTGEETTHSLDDVERELGLDHPAEDMNDPANWRAGDVVRATEHSIDITEGREYVIAGTDLDGAILIKDDAGDVEGRYPDNFTFVRRP